MVPGAFCSLALHHLDASGKQRLFKEAAGRLSQGGALLVADLIDAPRAEPRELYAAMWDASADRQSRQIDAPDVLEICRQERWNHYRFPDPIDRPSGLAEQLEWLRVAGFDYADCFWLSAGHAIYGGYLAGGGTGSLTYMDALESVRTG